MKARGGNRLGLCAALLALALVPMPAQTTDPAKVADFEKRFATGRDLEQQGRLADARAVFDGILAEEPAAKGSLREAGFISVRMNDLVKADGYFARLHALVPDYPEALEALIQINQSLGRDVKVQHLLADFQALHDSGKVAAFTGSLYFVRERIHLEGGTEIVVTQFFDYHQEPNTAWMAEMFDSTGTLQRRVLLNYDPEATKEIRAKEPKLASAEEFLLLEDVIRSGRIKELDVYQQIFALPEYKKVRNTMLAVMAKTPKPIYSAPVDAAL